MFFTPFLKLRQQFSLTLLFKRPYIGGWVVLKSPETPSCNIKMVPKMLNIKQIKDYEAVFPG